MRREFLVPLILGILAFGMILWSPQTGWSLRGIILGETGSVNNLALENQSLRSELEALQYLKETLYSVAHTYVPAMVYARYPGNVKNELLIAVGELQGIHVGQSVVIFPFSAETSSIAKINPFLVGKITRTSKESAVATTIFDIEWKSAVRIGKTNREALLLGGNNPRLTLIEKKTSGIQENDMVRNASRDFPYGLAIGEVTNVGLSADRLYEEASIRFPYAIGELRMIYVDTAFEDIRESQ